MKFTLFALFAAFCLLSVNAGTLTVETPRDVDLEAPFLPSDVAAAGEVDAEQFWIFSSVWWAIKTSLRTLKGFNCIIKWVVGIKASASQFSADITGCGVTASKDVTNLINANVKIIQTCNDIINLQSNICNTTSDDQKISNNCAVKTLAKVFSLYKQVKNAVSLAKKIPQTGPNAVSCVSDAVNTLTAYYTQFPQNIVACSKLTS
ncbi:uncharacterized protein LOC115629281 [Scaptodrosophila lebanonensis]|uniref:Uncharacterized protein LOC115629281 n=1 Tax=Drosophila lebanonensis TaxID=7225 RepID=A0A6J2U0Z7_DROLE|nr:uncharacterized protein LOC115629281 [Scaptodrosophila lebanonensis]